MRLLNTSTYELHDDAEPALVANPDYAILSHRWQMPEISFQAFKAADVRDSSIVTPQLVKIRQACAKARQREHPIDWLWMDTCCIDKSNAVEQARSINSMFDWYRRAAVCIVYLYDVDADISRYQYFESQLPGRPHQMSEWFERGWTLQELLAPENVEFYGSSWTLIGKKTSLAGHLELVTGIRKTYLTGESKISSASVATRMSWMAGRTTTLVEDIAYSMLGIFNINMNPQYGEGVKAFMRLQKALIESSTDESLFAWTTPPKGLVCYRRLAKVPHWMPQAWGLLAPSPDCFAKLRDLVIIDDKVVPRLSGGYKWGQQGVQLEMPIKAGTEMTNMLGLPRKKVYLSLNCWRIDDRGLPLTIQVHLLKSEQGYQRIRCSELGEKEGARPSSNNRLGINQVLTRSLTVIQPPLNM